MTPPQIAPPPDHPLLDVLEGRSPPWAERARRVVREAHRVVGYTLSTFSGGTDHTARHTMTVEAIARMLLPDAFIAALTPEELFFLVAACHYHDLAMAGTEADDASAEAREQVRRDHAVRVGDRVRERWTEFGFEDQRTAQVLGEVCRGHRPKKSPDGTATWEELNPVAVLSPGSYVRVRLVAAVVYAADELHLGADRAPVRVQSWREIRDEESRRHWRRHQAVNGPAVPHDGRLLFQVDAGTPGFEENLRTQVFRKALGGLRDLGAQAGTDGVDVPLPLVHLQWNREETWRLLLPAVCSDLRPRSADEIEQALRDRWTREATAGTDLGDLCVEQGNGDAELQIAVRRCVGDAITCRRLVPAADTAGQFVLSAGGSVADTLFREAREADELDRLYLGRYCPSWEERLFESGYGRWFVATCVLPAVDRAYSVRLAQRPAGDPIRVLLERCPTAARLVREFRPPPSNLAKEVLLRQAVVTGALFDLHADPNRILDRGLRAAVHELTRGDEQVSSVVRLVEELALVGGLTADQVTAAHGLSEAARRALEAGPLASPGIQITVSQSVPADAPSATSHLPSLLLASQRAGFPIVLAPAPDHVLDVRVTSEAGVPRPGDPPAMLGVGPAQPEPRGPCHFPARVELSRASRTVRFLLGRFGGGSNVAPYPTVVRVPPPPGDRPTATIGVVVQRPNLTVQDVRTLEAAERMLRSEHTTVQLLMEDGGALLASLTPDGPAGLVLGEWEPNAVRGLRGLDGDLPVPLLVPHDRLVEVGRMSAADRSAWWQSLRPAGPSGRTECCSVFSRIATPAGVPVEERFLRFLPRNPFPPPGIGPGGTYTQADLDRAWTAGEVDFQLTAFFDTEVYEMARLLREWCQNPRSEFPFTFRFGPDSVPTPLTRSVLTVHFPRVIDRVWHRERAVVFEFRPVSRDEAYELEANYWRASGQDARAALADEIRARETQPQT